MSATIKHGGSWPKNPRVYEINARVWLHELSRARGSALTLAEVPRAELDRLGALGFDAIWLMGVWTVGPEARAIARWHPDLQAPFRAALDDYTSEDCLGSPYAVAEYEVAPELGGPAALEVLRAELARRGLRLLLDFVANHTGRDHRWIHEAPEAYIRGSFEDLLRAPHEFFRAYDGSIVAHGRDPYYPPWSDTAQLNYGQAPAREMIEETLLEISSRCDGLRCDMAMLTLPEIHEGIWEARMGDAPIRESFWSMAIQAVRARHPGFLFLSEAYWETDWRLVQEGFDYTYDKRLYDRLAARDHEGVRQHLRAPLEHHERCARFVENHDEERAPQVFGWPGAASAAAVTYFTPGLRLFHHGQLEGARTRIPVQLARGRLEEPDTAIQRFYEKLLAFLGDSVFRKGRFRLLEVRRAGAEDSSADALIALLWRPARAQKRLACLVVANRNQARSYARIPLAPAGLEPRRHYELRDRLDGQRYQRSGAELLGEGLFVAMEPDQVHLFEIFPWKD